MQLVFDQAFQSRREISLLLGGDLQKGITASRKTKSILLFMNSEELYTDYFYPQGTYHYCMYTGIGRKGHQDSPDQNATYNLNMAVLNHKANHQHLLVFEKRERAYHFIGEYSLTETHQNIQPDDAQNLRRVFVFHLERISDTFMF